MVSTVNAMKHELNLHKLSDSISHKF